MHNIAESAGAASVFHEENCRSVDRASYASVLIDCANYYRALHEAVCAAKRSIFVLGWDIDSRIELLRGEAAKASSCPATFFGLIQWKARQNPSLEIYLNRWDYSWFLAGQREGLSKIRWRLHSPRNIHYCLDGNIPVGACHHQKLVVIDDTIAFCGGMDIAIGRWDRRDHKPRNRRRKDPGGTYEPVTSKPYGPYHDVQLLVAGPVVRELARLARERWRLATGYRAVALRAPARTQDLPDIWPKSAQVHFTDVRTGVALTMPPAAGIPAVCQIERLYLDMIARAERFIYMENQFFTRKTIAQALKLRMERKPDLRCLLVSCYDPEGIMERKSMWGGRVRFMDMFRGSEVNDRIILTYPVSVNDSIEKPVRIHSKLMIVDDRLLRIGSSNINNRSMKLDTECDLVIEAEDSAACQAVAGIRNDLIREHTGLAPQEIQRMIDGSAPVSGFACDVAGSTQHLRRVDDEAYRHESFIGAAIRLADPVKPFLPVSITMPVRYSGMKRGALMRLLLAVALIAAAVLIWRITPLAHYASPEKLAGLLENLRETAWSVPVALAIYTIGCMIFFPHMVLTAATAITFRPLETFLIALTGSLVSASIGFMIGRLLGKKYLRLLLGFSFEKINHYLKKGGVLGITFLRMLPIAPYTAVNVGLGITGVPFGVFLAGTCLGMLPGILAFSFLGHSLMDVIRNPDKEHMVYAGLAFCGWIGVLLLSHIALRRWQAHSGRLSK
jgi:phosphatidylserine/phosphatidylglycerophosphate/cardiolipin synthase-like enzyme/uncharacterized membrane protein YdjX (TVP38/TMEM64 family)